MAEEPIDGDAVEVSVPDPAQRSDEAGRYVFDMPDEPGAIQMVL